MKSKTIKRCSDCGRFLGENNFPYRDKKKIHRNPYCKKCASNRSYLWRLDNKEKCCDYKKIWYLNNQEKHHEYYKQYYQNNRKHIIEYSKQYRENNPEQYKQWCENNREQLIEYHKQYRENNREKYYEHSRLWRLNNLDKANAQSALRRALKRNQTPILTEIEKKKIHFYYQTRKYLGKNWHVDHIKPLSKGGLHHPDNLQILAKKLNREKRDKYPLTEEEKVKFNGIIL